MDLRGAFVHGGSSSRQGAGMPRPSGAGVREWARRLRPLLAAHYVRPVPGASDAVLQLPGSPRSKSLSVSVAHLAPVSRADVVRPLRRLLPADVLVVAPTSLPRGTAAQIRRLPGVIAAQSVDAATIRVNGKFVAMLGVNPSAFRGFAAKPTAVSSRLWQSVADGRVAVSYTMGRLDKLPLGGVVKVAGRRTEKLRVGGFGTVGIRGI